MATGLPGQLRDLSGQLESVAERLEAAALMVGAMVKGGVKLEAEHRWLVDARKWLRSKAQDWAMLAQDLDRPR